MNISGVTKHFATPSEVYTNNLSASISAGAVTVPVNANNDYTDGDIVVLTVEPGTTNEATFTGEKASTPARFINCVWTEGNVGVGHASGSTITDYDSATHFGMATKGIKLFANQDGTLKTSAVQAALNISAAVPSDYTSLAQTATTITPNGQKSYSLLFPGVNYTDRLSPGMRLRTVRSTVAPTQSALFDGVNDYFVKAAPAGYSFTDDFVASAWIKVLAYPTVVGVIHSKYNGVSGYVFDVAANGTVALRGKNAGAGNESNINSYSAVPLKKWIHVAAQLDMSAYTATPTTSYVMFDGVDVPSQVNRIGTNPTSILQAGNFEIGSTNGGTSFFNGVIAQAAIFNAKLTQTQVRAYMSQGLIGTETSLISAYTLSNSLNDLNTTNANNLTANGGVLTTNTESPFGTLGDFTVSTTVDHGIIQKSTYSAPDTTVVLQVPDGSTIPTSGGVASVSYSQFRTPYQFPADENRWTLSFINSIDAIKLAAVAGTWYFDTAINATAAAYRVQVPVGSWVMGFKWLGHAATGAATFQSVENALSTTSTTTSDDELSVFNQSGTNLTLFRPNATASKPIFANTPTTYSLLSRTGNSSETGVTGTSGPKNYTYLKNAYL
jgi:hypothetical protein